MRAMARGGDLASQMYGADPETREYAGRESARVLTAGKLRHAYLMHTALLWCSVLREHGFEETVPDRMPLDVQGLEQFLDDMYDTRLAIFRSVWMLPCLGWSLAHGFFRLRLWLQWEFEFFF
jgi:hypothetical protein